jgi:lactoylglutathione lyase
MSSTTENTAATEGLIPGRPTWQQTMLRIKDPVKSLKFYSEHLGFTLIDTFDFPQWKFSLYFLTTLPEGETYDLTPGTQAAHDYLWNMEGVALELTHNHGSENDDAQKSHPGNQENDGTYQCVPYRTT